MRLYSEYLENFHLLDVGKYFQRPEWPKGEGVDLSLGQPDFDVPLRIRHTGADAILNGSGGYVSAKGQPELREKIAITTKSRYGLSYDADQVLVTPGSSAALYMAMHILVSPGDEVILFDPYFAGYKACAQLVGAHIKYIDTYPDFVPDPQHVRRAVNDRTKLIVLNTPNNPTGAVYPERILREIAAIAREHNIMVLSDEVYEDFVYDGAHIPFSRFYDNTITIKSFSKSHAMTGWRIGYALGPHEIIKQMTLVTQYLFACVPPFVQKAALTALDMGMTHRVNAYRGKRDMLFNGLKNRYRVTRPKGAYYAMVKTPCREQEFVDRLLKNKIVVFPGRVFSEREGSIRLSFATDNQSIKQAVSILNNLM